MTHQPENISAFAWGLEPLTMSSESPTKRRRTTTHKYIEQDLQQTMEMEIKTKGPAPRNRTKTWPCDASSSQQLSQDTPATLAQFSPATAALTMVAQHVKLPPWIRCHSPLPWPQRAYISTRSLLRFIRDEPFKRSGPTQRLRLGHEVSSYRTVTLPTLLTSPLRGISTSYQSSIWQPWHKVSI